MRSRLTLLIPASIVAVGGCLDEPRSRASLFDGLSTSGVEELVGVGEAGSYPLHNVWDRAIQPDGSFAVLATPQVLFYSSSGELIDSVGRQGDGPGDFQTPSLLTDLGGDRVGVWDMYGSRFYVIAGGEVVETISPNLSGIRGNIRPVGVVDGFDDRPSLVFWTERPVQGMRQFESGVRTDTIPLYRDVGARVADGLLTSVTGETQYFYNFERAWGRRSFIFPQPVLFDAVEGGLIIADASTGLVDRVSLAGDRTNLLHVPPSPWEFTDEAVERERQALKVIHEEHYGAFPWTDALDMKAYFDALEATPVSQSLAAFDALEAERDGTLWLRRYLLAGDSVQRWVRVPEGAGEPDLEVQFPAGEKVLDVRGDRILVLRTGESDVQTVVLYRIVPS